MKALIQRTRGKTQIEIENAGNQTAAAFDGVGLVVLLGWLESDAQKKDLDACEDWILSRIVGLRIFEDAAGKMNLSLADYAKQNSLASGILWVSQFTLAAELESGFRPSFIKAMKPDLARARFDEFAQKIARHSPHKNIFGIFGASMQLSFTNWGPVTIMLEK